LWCESISIGGFGASGNICPSMMICIDARFSGWTIL
jgi:hypothetical protein